MRNWIKFDQDDKTTWPPESSPYAVVNQGGVEGARFEYDYGGYGVWCIGEDYIDGQLISHWQPLPEPPED